MKRVIIFLILLSLIGCIHTKYVANIELHRKVIDSSNLPKYDLVIGIQFRDESSRVTTKDIKGDLASEVSSWFAYSLEEDKIFKKVVDLNIEKGEEVDVILKGVIKSVYLDSPGVSVASQALAWLYGLPPIIDFYTSRKKVSSSAIIKFQLIDPRTYNLLWSKVIQESVEERITLQKSKRVMLDALSKTAGAVLTEPEFPEELNKIALKVSPGVVDVTKKAQPRLYEIDTSLQREPVAQRWAVIIGISAYRDSRIPSLRYATADALSFHNWLISPDGGRYPPSRVKLMLNEQATGHNIRDSLFVWLQQAIEEDMVLIFFAGHGSPESPDSPGNLFLLPYDVQYDNIATTGFPMWDIETALKRFVKAKKVVVMADACHAGGVGQAFDIARRADRGIKVNPISSALQTLSTIGDGIAVITASDDEQYSQESEKWGGGHGVFSYFLLEGLKGAADYNNDNRVTLGEIIPYLSEQVRRATRNAQSPTVAGKFDPALSIER